MGSLAGEVGWKSRWEALTEGRSDRRMVSLGGEVLSRGSAGGESRLEANWPGHVAGAKQT